MRPMTREQIAARYAEGFGQGEGKAYRPWLEAHDVPSLGGSHRIPGWKVGRKHVLFSHIERHAFLAAQWLDRVVDIREQFPLWPIEETETIADELGISHPVHPKGAGSLVLLTTDLLLTTRDRGFEAIAVKPETELIESRVLEKLEIERLYWKRRDVPWSIVTDRDLPEALVANLVWIDNYYYIGSKTVDPQQIPQIEAYLIDVLAVAIDVPLNRVCAEADDRLGHSLGTCLGVVRHALARKRWRVALDRKIDPGSPLPAPVLASTEP